MTKVKLILMLTFGSKHAFQISVVELMSYHLQLQLHITALLTGRRRGALFSLEGNFILQRARLHSRGANTKQTCHHTASVRQIC